MDVIVSLEAHFSVTADGRAWSKTEFDYQSWSRYLEVFDRVTLLGRAKPALRPPDGWHEVTGERVRLHPIPDYTGPAGYVLSRRAVSEAIQRSLSRDSAVIMRVPSQIATCAASMLADRPFALEVVGDPADVFTYRSIRRRLAFAYRWWFTRNLRRQCSRATAVAYVTRHALQRRYPAGEFSLGVSDVHLPDSALSTGPKVYATHFSSIQMEECHLVSSPRTKLLPVTKLITVGSLAQWYKGTDVLIDAVARCRQSGLRLHLTIVGDGACRPDLEKRVTRNGLRNQVFFAGQVTFGDAVRRLLDDAQVFVLPSRCEGLPRAMIEAMARGLPCIGSAIGGIPEILPPEDMVPPGDIAALAQKIKDVVHDSRRLQAMSERNLRTAMEYRSSILAERRRNFYRHVRMQTENWLKRTA